MRNLLLAVLVGALGLGHPGLSEAQLVLYDDFSSPLIDPDKWFGTDATGGAANPTTEAVRAIKSGKLELRLDQYGLSNTDSGTSGGQIRLEVTNPAPITTMQAAVTALSGEAQACATNPGALVRARSMVGGGFFNDGASTGPGDRTGDIIGTVAKTVDATLGNIFVASITRCTNAACSATSTVSFQNFVSTWAFNQTHTLTLTWDAANNQFVFSVKPVLGGSPETITLPYAQNDASPPVASFRELLLNHSAANCNGSQLHAFMDVQFDTVMVNP